jgi:hypothetical protein
MSPLDWMIIRRTTWLGCRSLLLRQNRAIGGALAKARELETTIYVTVCDTDGRAAQRSRYLRWKPPLEMKDPDDAASSKISSTARKHRARVCFKWSLAQGRLVLI